MNKLQRRNQRSIRGTLNRARLIASIDVVNGHVVEVETLTWGDYWEGCDSLVRELEQLYAAWIGLIGDGYSVRRRGGFVQAYFALLHTCLKKFSWNDIGLNVLRKVVAIGSECAERR